MPSHSYLQRILDPLCVWAQARLIVVPVLPAEQASLSAHCFPVSESGLGDWREGGSTDDSWSKVECSASNTLPSEPSPATHDHSQTASQEFWGKGKSGGRSRSSNDGCTKCGSQHHTEEDCQLPPPDSYGSGSSSHKGKSKKGKASHYGNGFGGKLEGKGNGKLRRKGPFQRPW